MHSSLEGFDIKRVNLFIQTELTALSGYWQWDMASDAVFCSDVILTFPSEFEGTKGIIHPDDLAIVKDALLLLETARQVNLEFRIITTYGEVKKLTGQHVFKTEPEPQEEIHPEQAYYFHEQHHKALQLELAQLQQKQQVFEEAGKIAGAGIWYYNKYTQEVYYSDQVYLFHSLPPQSLNAHLNTFTSFIHPDDRDIVLDAFEKVFAEEIPLQLEYRIITASGLERHARNVLQWTYTNKGDRLLQGVLQDYTVYKTAEAYEEQTDQQLWFLKQRLLFSESNSNSGFWQLDIVTRKFTPSENFFRLHGLKPQAATGGLNFFLNYVHPDDQALVEGYFKTLRKEHIADDITYRIIRPDGKQRYLRQQAKSMIDDQGHLILFGLAQDITTIIILEEKLKEKTESYQLNQYGLSIGESMVNTGTWWWNQQSNEQYWSDGMYQLLGYKPQSVTLTQQHLLKLTHPEYRKTFTDALTLALREEQDANFELRLSRGGETRQLRVGFKLFSYEGKRVFIGVFQDITKERQLQQELSERIQIADLLTENLPDRVFITDNENNILFWNRQCEKYYKQKRDQLLGKNFFEVFPQLQTDEKVKQFNDVLKGQAVHVQGTRSALGKDIADLHMLPLYDSGKDVIGILHILHDTTEETTLRQNLTERLHFIQNLVEASVDRVVALDRHMNYIYWNRRAEQYYDLQKEKVLGKNILEIFPAFVNDPSFGEFRRALRGETVHIPASAITTDQHGQYFETYLIPVKATNEEVTSILWITRDLSNEYQLLHQQQKSDEILNSVNAVFFEIDWDNRFRYVNAKAEQYFEKTRDELLGQNIWELAPQAIGTPGHQAIVTAQEERTKTETEYFSRVFNKWMYLSAAPSPDGVIILMYDRQDIKEIQTRLQESETLLRRSEEVAAIGSYEADLATMTFRFSDGMYRLFGEEPQSFVPTQAFIDARSHPDDVPVVQQKLEWAIQHKEPYYYTRRIYRADGEMRTVEAHGKILCDAEGTPIKLIGLVQDITQRKEAESQLQKNFTLLQQSEDVAGTGSWEYDIASGAFQWSPGMYRMFNMAPGTPVQPEVYLRLSTSDDKAKAERLVDQLTKHYTSFEETLHITADGQLKTIKCKGTVVYDQKGQPEKMLGIDIDITEMDKAASEIRRSQHFLQQVTDTAPDAITVFDLSQEKASYINPPVIEALLGYSVAELDAMGFEGRLQKVIHPDDQNILIAFNERLKKAPLEEVLTQEYRVITKEGATKWLANRGKSFLSNEPGHPKMILSVLQDISNKKALYEQLAERTTFAEAVVESSVDAIIVVDSAYNIKTWNRQCEALYGVSKEKALNHTLIELFPKIAEDATLMNSFHRAMQGELMYLPAKQSVYTNRTCEFFYVPLTNEQGQVYGVLNIIHDVSRQEEYATALQDMNLLLQQQNVELEQRNEEIATFAFVASHDLKEPLRKIHTFSDWLLERETEQLSAKGQDFLKRLNASVHRLNMLIEDILVLTKIHTDTRNDEDVNLNEVIRAVEEDLDELITSTKTSVLTEPLPTITSNRNQLFYLFRNLMHNAIKFRQPGTKPVIEISADVERNVNHPHAQPKREYLKIAIQDNGIGFDAKYTRKIFKIFQQLHARGEYTGTGMGLAICRKIMENNKGFITAESTPGEGSVFYCYFPLY